MLEVSSLRKGRTRRGFWADKGLLGAEDLILRRPISFMNGDIADVSPINIIRPLEVSNSYYFNLENETMRYVQGKLVP